MVIPTDSQIHGMILMILRDLYDSLILCDSQIISSGLLVITLNFFEDF